MYFYSLFLAIPYVFRLLTFGNSGFKLPILLMCLTNKKRCENQSHLFVEKNNIFLFLCNMSNTTRQLLVVVPHNTICGLLQLATYCLHGRQNIECLALGQTLRIAPNQYS